MDITLEAGKIYYVEFVGVMWNYGQYFGVGMTKKTTPYQTYDVDTSRKEYPYWYWKQDYSDEIQVCSYVSWYSAFCFWTDLLLFWIVFCWLLVLLSETSDVALL